MTRIFLIVAISGLAGCLPYHRSRIPPGESLELSPSARAEKISWFTEREAARRESIRTLSQLRPSSGSKEYHVLPGDMISIDVRAIDEEKAVLRVQGDGTITLPLVKRMHVAGQTPQQIEDRLVAAYRKFYMEPEATVTVTEFHGRPVAILGNVDKPGTYYLQQDETPLMEVLSLAGGFKGEGGDRVIIVPSQPAAGAPLDTASSHRESNESAEPATVEEVQARAQLGSSGANVPSEALGRSSAFHVYKEEVTGDVAASPLRVAVRAGDTLFLPGMGKVQVQGEVEKPGTIPLTEKMTVLGAIAGAGGIKLASSGTAEVTRVNPDGTTVSTVVDLSKAVGNPEYDLRLEAGDMVRLPSGPFWYMFDSVVNAVPRLLHTGFFYQVG